MNKIKKIYELLSMLSLILMIVYINIGTILIIMTKLDYLKFSKYLSYFSIVYLILYIIYKIIFKEFIKTKDILIILLSLFGYISYYFAINQEIALLGASNRNEGLYSLVTYYMTYLISTTISEKNQKRVISIFLVTGIIQIIIGIFQTLRIENILGYDRSNNWSTHFKFASGTIGNPNFYSTYILLCLVYVYGLLIKSKKIFNIIIRVILMIIFIYGLIIGNTMSCMLTFLIILTITLLKKINRKNVKKVFIIGVIIIPILIFSILILDNFCNNRITFTMNKNFNEVIEIINKGITDETGNYRIYIWRKTIENVPKNIFTGIGIDNFSLINNGTYLCTGEGTEYYQCFDKVHNEYLQKLITEGVFSIITYLTLISYTIYISIKNKKYNNVHYFGLILVLFSYLIQANLNISVITVAPFFYMIMGFLNDKIEVSYEK